ncbi:MAG: NADH-quinone oxidoreductase subunit N [Bacteroidetes bacterium]|nr:NADH-quinone oxidoreductase subunit N [Bacteroidota bacterium]
MNAIIALSALAILTMFFGVIQKKSVLLPLILSGLIIVFFLNVIEWGTFKHYYNEMFIADNFNIAFTAALILTTFLVFIFSALYYRTVKRPLEDIYALMLFSLIGGITMASFGNITMLFIGIETLSISFYILAGSKKFDVASNEAALKYFLTGTFATGFLLFGMALIYGVSGSFNLQAINSYIIANKESIPTLFYAGMILVFVGMAFKIAAVPFHFWAPDVYTGSPTLITAFMSTIGKVASIAAFYRLISITFLNVHDFSVDILMLFAIATIIVGNLSAMTQDNMKRMLAYSGISNSGYLLFAIIAMGPKSAGTLLYFSISYAIATITAFAVIMLVREERGTFSLQDYKGLAKQNPVEAFAMAVAMMSLAGIPPLAGFMAKYNIFSVAMNGGYVWLVIVGVIGSMISVFYYFKPIIYMYFHRADAHKKIETTKAYKIHILLVSILLIILGFLPGLVIGLL